MKKGRETARLSLEVSDVVRARMADLQARTEADSLTAVVRRALQVYDLLVTHQEGGGRVVLRDEGGEQLLVLP